MAYYTISDLHGHYDLYEAVKNFISPHDKVICLGDCGDRGPRSWETIKAVYYDPQWIYLMGNHEHMLLYAIMQYYKGQRGEIYNPSLISPYTHNPTALLQSNGGYSTFLGWMRDGENYSWIDRLAELPTYYHYVSENKVDIYLSHAGFTPNTSTIPDQWELVWNRNHFTDEWPDGKENTLIIHGHTPCEYLKADWVVSDGAYQYAGDHKIDIDMGTAWNGATCLLNLDTLEEIIFNYGKGES